MTDKDFSIPDTSNLKESPLPIIWVLGGPGSGKGTQCDKIVARYGFTHISTGDLLREVVSSGSERGQALEAIMKEGKLVSSNVVLSLLAEKMLAELPNSKGYLIDGYPRELVQGHQFEKDVGLCRLVLYFEASDETLTKRLLTRALTSGREDDNEETIKKRLNTFHANNNPIVESYAGKTKKINAEEGADVIFGEVVSAIESIKCPIIKVKSLVRSNRNCDRCNRTNCKELESTSAGLSRSQMSQQRSQMSQQQQSHSMLQANTVKPPEK